MAIFRRLLGFLAPYRRGVAVSALLAAIAMAATVLIPWLTGQAIDSIREGDSSDLDKYGLLVAGAGVARLVLTVGRRLVAGRVSLGVEYDLRQRLYTHLLSLELSFFDRQQTGQLMSRATVDLAAVRFFLGYGLVFIMQSALTIVLAGVAMVLVDPILAVISLVPVPFVVVIASRYGRRARPAQQAVQQRIAELTADAEESIGGVRVVKAFAREDRQLARFKASTGRVFEQEMVATRLSAFYQPLIGFLPQIGLACVLLIGGRRVVAGHMTLGDFTAFYSYLLMLLVPMRQLGMTLGLAQRATASGARLFEIFDRGPAITAPAAPTPLPEGNGHVEVDDVTFTYTNAPGPALRDVSLDVPAGTTVALVGATGSGKTTLVQLLGRLYDVDSGSVSIDGVDVRALDPVQLHHAIAVVDDAPFLFSSTIADNIAYARGGADAVAREDIELAARRAQAHEFIVSLPDGYDTRVGERGLTLSGGQRQRVAIARALLADPRILILDDATSAVDASTEQQIKDALREVMAGRTTFVIAHRLSTIALADVIVVVEDGQIVAQGCHDELLEVSPLYREIVEKGLPDQVFLNREDPEREVAGL
ncbi:ABC transporter ATP-binding protein [Baekduia sp. Peel2402]|uniref:ABC transporter ATP-binding protein n=1 Tax=Baekduia sp. Peel2402 TaxID=3458296 RepID=UPI00403EF045